VVVRLDIDRVTWLSPLTCLAGVAAVLGGVVVFADEVGRWDGPATAGSVLAVLFGLIAALLGGASWLAGDTYVRVDVSAGTLAYVEWRKVAARCALDALGELTIEEKSRLVTHRPPPATRGGSGTRVQRYVWYELRAAGLARCLLSSSLRPEVERRRDALELLIAQSAVRRVLETAREAEGGHRGRDIPHEAARAAGSPARLSAALAALARDPDPHVQRRVAELRARSSGT
jgi:hypothetical protein